MDTDGLPSAAVFVAFLLLFSYLSVAQHSAASTSRLSANSKPPGRFVLFVSWLKYACVIATALSGLALVHSTGTVRWLPASFLALALLVFLIAIDRVGSWAAIRPPAWAVYWRRALGRAPLGRAGEDHGVTNGDINEGDEGDRPGGELAERMQPAITHAELVRLDQRDREMLRSILRLDVTTAREIMTPRLDMVSVEADSDLTQVSETIAQRGHSRLPVYEETIDRILGLVHARDVLAVMAGQNSEQSLRDLVRPAFIIPETKRLDELLEELQDKGVQMAIVVDEHGGTEGLVTMEDVLEEIVGEIEDEFSHSRESLVVQMPDGAALVDAGITTENLEEIFQVNIDSADVDTVGGYVNHSLGKIPQVGDVVVTAQLRIEVVSVLGRRLRKLRIKRIDTNGLDEPE